MSSTAISAQGSVLAIGTGTGSAETISGVAVGNPTILTVTGTARVNGDRVTISGLTGAGASAINGNTYTVKYKETNSFAIDVDTTGATVTAGSGTATPVTFTSVANVRTFSGFDGAAVEIDRTNLSSTAKEFVLGLIDPGHLTFECDYDPTDSGQAALYSHQVASSLANFKITLPDTHTFTFNAYPKKISTAGGVDQIVKHQCELRITGSVTFT